MRVSIKVAISFLIGLMMPMAAHAELADITSWLVNIQSQLPAILNLIVATSYVCGVSLFVIGVMKLKAYGQQTVMTSTHANFIGPLTYIIVGSVLFYFPTMVEVGVQTFWGYGLESVLQYPNTGGLNFDNLINPIIDIIRIVGYIAFLRGWMILAKLGNHAPPGTLAKGIIHIIGGVLAINVVGTWQVFVNTLEGV